MKALPQDEFALEMRTHFLDSMMQTIGELNSEDSFRARFAELSLDWEAEAKSNDMPFLAPLLERLRSELSSNSLKLSFSAVCMKLQAYILDLRESGDSEEFAQKFYQGSESNVAEEANTYLQCRRGEMRFLLPVENVVEISRFRKINMLPNPESRIKGLIGFRGLGTPVFDLVHAGFPAVDEKSFFVICEHEHSFFALEVNATDDILKIKSSEFQPSLAGTKSQFTTKDNQILLLLDIPRLVA